MWDVVRCAWIGSTADRYLQLFSWGVFFLQRETERKQWKEEWAERRANCKLLDCNCKVVLTEIYLLDGSSNTKRRLSLRSTEVNRETRAQTNHCEYYAVFYYIEGTSIKRLYFVLKTLFTLLEKKLRKLALFVLLLFCTNCGIIFLWNHNSKCVNCLILWSINITGVFFFTKVIDLLKI